MIGRNGEEFSSFVHRTVGFEADVGFRNTRASYKGSGSFTCPMRMLTMRIAPTHTASSLIIW